MKQLYKIVFLFALSLVLGSCENDDALVVLNPNASTELTLSTNTVVLLKDNEGADVLNISWTNPDFGFDSTASYRILIDLLSGDFSEAQTISPETGSFSKIFENNELNIKLLNLGLEANIETDLQVMVQAVLGANTVISSEPQSFKATAFSGVLDLSSIWGVVGSATPNAWDGPDLAFYKTGTENEFVAYVTLADGQIKIRSNNSWDVNYGDVDSDGVLDQVDDNNITVTAGSYKIVFNSATLEYSIESFSWGIVGSATPNAWDGPDLNLEYDPYSDQWRALVALADGQIKIRSNNSWDEAYGDIDSDGVLDQVDDNNITVTAGNYLVTVNLKDLSYSIVKTDIWGVVGSATPNAWDGPDTKFSLDFSRENVWVLNGMELAEGQIKFRTNDSWDLAYGDIEPDGILDQVDDNNISVTAGTYNITLDFTDPNAITYTIE